MTIGQRIAQKRKEQGLSQEALGEKLGVSRQAIYKWESDTALPEIDKLIALSKLFGVSVGWLLGVEEGVPQEAKAAPPEADTELSEAQLAMVKEIVEQYLAAQPKSKPRRKWPWVLAVAALLIVGANLFNRLEQLNDQYDNLQWSISDINNDVNSQISGISSRVEEILKAQNSLTAEYDAEVLRINLKENRVLFDVYATPKTYIEGMEVKFAADNHTGGISQTNGEMGTGRSFTGTLASQITDEITLSVIFTYPDGRQERQVLDTFTGLLTDSLPPLEVQAMYLFGEDVADSSFDFGGQYVTTRYRNLRKDFYGNPAAEVAEVRLGVFRNQRLLGWATACEQPDNFHGDYKDQQFYLLPDVIAHHLTDTDKLYIAALVTDTYDRQFMACDVPFVVEWEEDGSGRLTYPSDGRYDNNPDNWTFD